MKSFYTILALAVFLAACSTGAMWEDTAPSTIGSNIENGATDVDPNTASFTVTFVKTVDVSTVTTSTFFIVKIGAEGSISRGAFNSGICDPSGAVSGAVTCASATECSFTSSSPLDNSAEYAVCLTDGIMYEDGNRYPGRTITFTTAEEEAGPADEIALSVTPLADATGVAVNATVQAVFSEEMDNSSITTDTFTLVSGNTSVNGSVSYSATTKTATFTSLLELAYLTTYTATVSGSVKDSAGNEMGEDYSWDFTTEDATTPPAPPPAGDITPPTITSVSPADGATDVAVDTAVEAIFSEAMDALTLTTDTFLLDSITGTVSYTDATRTATFDPSSGLSYNTEYTATITTDVEDANGVSLAAAYIWSFTTIDVLGILDEAFSGDGILFHNSAAGGNSHDIGTSITTDSSGRILVTGGSTNGSGNYDMTIWRYNTNGVLDSSFSGDGFVIDAGAAGGTGDDTGQSITTDSSGKILVAGNSANFSGDNDMVIWRYNSDGTLDTSFDSDGILVHNNAAGGDDNDVGNSITTDSLGRILVTGYSNNDSEPSNADMVIWRCNTNGTLDTSFSDDGIVVHGSAAGGNGYDSGQAITTDSSGRILVTGYSFNTGGNADTVIWRYNSNGTLDDSFDSDGFVAHNNAAGGGGHDYGYGITIDSSGKILVAGSSYGSGDDMAVWRYNSDGTLDASFSDDGIVFHNNAAGGGGHDYGRSITTDSSGRILVTGYSFNDSEPSNPDMVIWRYNSDGTPDTGFGDNGIVVHDSAAGGENEDIGYGIITDSSGRILVTGYSFNTGGNADTVIWRYK